MHAENRSHLYEPFDSNGLPTGGYDSLDRLLQYQRGTLASTGGSGGNGGGSIALSGSTPLYIAVPNTDWTRAYELDGLGNWRRTTFTPQTTGTPVLQTEVRQHNGLNQITRRSNPSATLLVNPTYDKNGNLTFDGTLTYTWDALNRLASADEGDTNLGAYNYDALNRRVRKTVSSTVTDCVYSGWRCVEERNPDGESGDTPTMQYVWGTYLDELIQQLPLLAINGFPANSPLYPLQDLLYRTTGLADSSGTVREAYDSDAYGNTLIFRNSGSPPAPITFASTDPQVVSPTCPFIFTGQRLDAETASITTSGDITRRCWGGS